MTPLIAILMLLSPVAFPLAWVVLRLCRQEAALRDMDFRLCNVDERYDVLAREVRMLGGEFQHRSRDEYMSFLERELAARVERESAGYRGKQC